MLEIFLIVLAQVLGGAGEDPATVAAASPASALQAEDQVATGKFLTALEVKPILTATKGNWVALRDWDGQDLLYVTHLYAWRCGLVELRIAVNDGAPEIWPLPECHADSPAPNAILPEDGLPYRAFARGSVASITVEITYDDLSVDTARFERAAVMMP